MGMRGSGKSSIGLALAQRLGRPFIDLDDCSAREALTNPAASRADIQTIFSTLGEPAFRLAETRALAAQLGSAPTSPPTQHPAIIALGGGTPIAPGAEDLIQQARAAGSARVVYLRADVATLRHRISQEPSAHRPTLTGRPIEDEIGSILAAREPVYQRMADHTVEITATEPVESVVARVLELLA